MRVLAPGGILLVREIDSDDGIKARANRLYERLATGVGFTRSAGPKLSFRGAGGWTSLLATAGFTVRAERCGPLFFADVLFVAHGGCNDAVRKAEYPRGPPLRQKALKYAQPMAFVETHVAARYRPGLPKPATPHLSIVIPTWNGGQQLSATLTHLGEFRTRLKFQTEIVIVDDCSGHSTARLPATSRTKTS